MSVSQLHEMQVKWRCNAAALQLDSDACMYDLLPRAVRCQKWRFVERFSANWACRAALVIIPGKVVQGSLWTLVTSNFVEIGVAGLVADVAALLVALGIAQPVYGAAHISKLLAVSSLSAGLTCFVSQYMIFAVVRYGSGLFTERYGFFGVLGGLVMAVSCTSATPEQIPRKKLPAAFLLLACVASVFAEWGSVMPFAVAGMLAAWWYILRMIPHDQRGAPRACLGCMLRSGRHQHPTLWHAGIFCYARSKHISPTDKTIPQFSEADSLLTQAAACTGPWCVQAPR